MANSKKCSADAPCSAVLRLLARVITCSSCAICSSWVSTFSLPWQNSSAPAVIDRQLKDTRAALKSPNVHQSLLSQGAEPGGQSPAEFGAYFQAEIRKWAKVIKSAGITLEQ